MASLFKKLIMMANTRKVPLGFEELKYIESDGNQWINTLIVPENGCWVTVDSQKTNTALDSFIFGASDSGNGKSSFNINDYTPKLGGDIYRAQTYFRYGSNDVYRSWFEFNSLPFPRKTFFIDSNGFRIIGNNGVYKEESFTQKNADFSQNKASIALFAILRADGSISNSTFSGRIYEYIYGVNEEERIHLIPALCIADSKPGMYDLVTGQFFVNQGTGEFTYG